MALPGFRRGYAAVMLLVLVLPALPLLQSEGKARVRLVDHRGVIFQKTRRDCGVAALAMILRDFNIPSEYESLARELAPGKTGTTMWALKRAAEARGLMCQGWRLSFSDLRGAPFPAIVLLRPAHFAVISRLSPSSDVLLLDPSRGRVRVPAKRFREIWDGETLLFTKSDGASNRWFQPLHRAP